MSNIESELFEYEGFDIQDTMAFSYYRCKLNQTIGKFKKDEVIESIYINFDHSIMEFYKAEEVIGKFHLTLSALPV